MPSAPNTQLASAVYAWRIREDLSQAQAAERSGVSVHTIVNLEKGQAARAQTLARLARAMGRDGYMPPDGQGDRALDAMRLLIAEHRERQ
jgi:transcriptional regulator with XRE-family HTH domain